MVYEGYKVYGPYKRQDGRMHVCLLNKETGDRKTVSFPKFLVEMSRNKYLEKNETIDHVDRNFSNNDLSNLRIVDRREHARIDVLRLEEITLVCGVCR